MRSRLLLLIIIPTFTAVILGGTRIVTSVQNALAYQRVEHLANLSSAITELASRLEDERDYTVQYIGQGANGRQGDLQFSSQQATTQQNITANKQLVTEEQQLTNPWVAKVRQQITSVGAGYPTQVQDEAQNIAGLLNDLPQLRRSSMATNLPLLKVSSTYTTLIDQLLAIDDNIALGSSDQTLATDVRSLGLVSRIAEETSEQRALLTYAYTVGNFAPGVLPALTAAQAEEQANLTQFGVAATPQQVTSYNNEVSGSLVDDAAHYEAEAIDFGNAGETLVITPNTANEVAGAFDTGPLAQMRVVEARLVDATISRASSLRQGAILTAAGIGAAVFIVLLLALLLTTVVGRSMVRPLRRLRSGALEVAGVRLPETVRRMSDSDGAAVPLEIDPINVDSSDEIGEVARAFDQVQPLREKARTAAANGDPQKWKPQRASHVCLLAHIPDEQETNKSNCH